MFGKYQSCFAVSLLVFFAMSPAYGQNTVQSINGYINRDDNPEFNRALRLQGIGDYFFKKNMYPQAVPYYEQALAIVPTEADITFKLAQIYQHEKLWRLAVLYYEQTIESLKQQENFGKSQLNSYISRIKLIDIMYMQNEIENAVSHLEEIQKERSLLEALYPAAFTELEILENKMGKSR